MTRQALRPTHRPRTGSNISCGLCGEASAPFFRDERQDRGYRSCPACGLVFRLQDGPEDLEASKRRYALHRNTPDDAGYVAFLNPVAEAVRARIPAGCEGLDFGCGPGPVLCGMLRAAGYSMSVYDPCFAPDEAALRRTYPFVVCTETVEHFHRPREDWERLAGVLAPGGVLFVMTNLLSQDVEFSSWPYRQDPTHAAFYTEETLRFLARRFAWTLERLNPTLTAFTPDQRLTGSQPPRCGTRFQGN